MAHITDVLKTCIHWKSMTLQAEENKYTFDVDVNANKIEIKQAVEAMFDVKLKALMLWTLNLKLKELVDTRVKLTVEEKLLLN